MSLYAKRCFNVCLALFKLKQTFALGWIAAIFDYFANIQHLCHGFFVFAFLTRCDVACFTKNERTGDYFNPFFIAFHTILENIPLYTCMERSTICHFEPYSFVCLKPKVWGIYTWRIHTKKSISNIFFFSSFHLILLCYVGSHLRQKHLLLFFFSKFKTASIPLYLRN